MTTVCAASHLSGTGALQVEMIVGITLINEVSFPSALQLRDASQHEISANNIDHTSNFLRSPSSRTRTKKHIH
ncbi:Hypothetical predicted protein [Octopus vulgaris]|uniref:Uncharacterized protein n=1 Tax=Octopus vulgaris TaxID=6645 RepID=A0AA36B1Z1_OCTVU|nr:Hypothetical predicted protein [Octopus vulgaris]